MFGARRGGKPKGQQFADGGRVSGPGTGTSDDIKTKVPGGTYIMPADSTREIGVDRLGAMGVDGPAEEMAEGASDNFAEEAAEQGRQVPVNLSNGEFKLPPEQVQAVGAAVLDALRNATHTPAEEQGEAAERPELFFADGGQVGKGFGARRRNFANGGLVDDPLKPKQNSFDVTNTPAAQTGFGARRQTGTGDLANALRDQPSSRMPELRFGIQRPSTGTAAGSGGGGGTGEPSVPGAIPAIPNYGNFGARRPAAPSLLAGQPAAQPAGTSRLTPEGIQQMTREAARTPFTGERVPLPGINQPKPDDGGWARTGFGAGRQGGEIAARIGANGIAEFSNDANTVASAGQNYGNFGARRPAAAPAAQPGYGAYRRTPEQLAAMSAPGGGQVLAAGTNAPTPAQELAATGSAANLGNGVGTFSQMQAGDSALALNRFERANQERQKMVDIAHRGELGNNGGQVTVVKDSSRMPTLQERQLARLDALQANTDATRTNAQTGANLASQRIANEQQQMGTEALNQQRLQQDIQQGGYGLQDQQRIDGLKASMVDPRLTQQQREEARDTYINLITQPKDRYRSQDVILGRDENGRDIRGTQLIDVTTGQPVAGGTTQGAPLRRSVTRAEVESAAKEDGVSVDDYMRALQAKGVMVS